MFYNTINLQGIDLKNAHEKELKQKEKVLQFFEINKDQKLTPVEVHKALFTDETPLTSIRRAITDLTKEGVLMQTSLQKQGSYGKLNYCWQYRK